jgi:cytochrome c oxidase assembly protein subunit 15
MLIQLAILGLLVAMLPLTVVWASKDANKYRKLAWVTLFLTFDLIMFGAFTRLTDSGLGCPDWPGCYGHANPVAAHGQISAAEAAMPHGPVTVAKAWIEMIHRYLAMAVGVLIVAMMIVAWRRWFKSGRRVHLPVPVLPTLLFGFVCLQGAFGAWTVTLKLQPVIVTIHLLLGMLLLAMLTWMAAGQNQHAPVAAAGARLRVAAAIGMLVLMMQITLGGWVSTNYAALACTDYPLCHGMAVPRKDFEHGFTLWRQLGMTAYGDYLPFDALTAIHWTHRSFALVVVAFLGWLGYKAMRIDGLRKTGHALLGMVVLQFLIGVATVFLNWPLAIAVLHNGGAALLVVLTVMLNYKTNLSAGPRPVRAARSATPA